MTQTEELEKHCGTAEEFLHALLPHNDPWAKQAEYRAIVYRGQGNANWELYPSAHREPDEREDSMDNRDWEYSRVNDFCMTMQVHGGAIPWERAMAHGELDEQGRCYLDAPMFPPNSYRELYAMAQHCGVRTRLLDWSYSPLIAAYFAARDGDNARSSAFDSAQRNHQKIDDSNLAVFILHLKEVTTAQNREGDWRILHINPIYTHNQNMIAQQGTFTLVQHSTRRHDVDVPCLRQVLCDSNRPSHWLRKLTLPWREAKTLRVLLYKLGIYAGSVVPGPEGAREVAAREMREQLNHFRSL